MRIEQLYYLIDIAKTHSISTTAQKIFSSQQAVSDAIRKMEKELDRILLNRSKVGVTLTDDGHLVVQYALDITQKYQEMLDQLTKTELNQQPVLTGSLNICVAPVIANTILPEVIHDFSNAYPQINLYIKETESAETSHFVSEGCCDIGIISVYENEKNSAILTQPLINSSLQFEKILSDHLVACVHSNCNLALKENLTLQDLANYKLTMYSSAFTRSIPIDQNDVLFISNNTDLHKKFISQELAVCQIPYLAFQTLFQAKEFISVPIIDTFPIITYLVYLNKDQLSPAAQAFIVILKKQAKKLTNLQML